VPKFGGRTSPGERLRRLSPHECKAWLCSHHEGRLGYQSGKGPRCVVVSYAVAGDQVLVRLPDYNDIVHYAPGSEVSLDVEGGTPAAHREAVTVTGTAELAESDKRPLIDQAAFQEDWPSDVRTSVICLPLSKLEGFELRDP
jgi:nitroimidazol reductase NimA-like FMN-containing flavoprotein (pyridoxamine 5'-phosphate oxidase superfamily)